MTATVVTMSAKGQITLPAKMRKNLISSSLLVYEENGEINLKALDLEKIKEDSNPTHLAQNSTEYKEAIKTVESGEFVSLEEAKKQLDV